ncbi:MAG: diaminopimelate decarboxylase [Gemmatimonadaceae bacterium]|nr:diaminopimelate decarboxylase [Gemmatimonadaceae bacterium]NUO93123.1 diaminopimelate decarboxylase [Gemmatimonadaceae bacterium]NUP70305.1 diaminopimelate decarboxylase [Gemmatimonadaceae bacterium]NUR32902.1 diaminopimelate decarboxylase [Gemmatimonadaceae bacterium]NUS31441.1 diaminopimelate decarboxylase [Gemmatimonadaceae bacterium]
MPEVRPSVHRRGAVGQGVLSSGFARVDGTLSCEGVPLDRIAADVGTPTYVYSAAMVRDRYTRLDEALAPLEHRIHYTLKANSNAGVLRVLRELGAGVDVVSGGELFRARKAGFEGKDIVFGGVGKTEHELREALEARVMLVNAESEAEVRTLDRIAGELGVVAPVGLRVNPEVTVDSSHRYIKTGEKGAKFGIPFDQVAAAAAAAATLPHVELVGLDMHIGSQLFRLDPYLDGVDRLVGLLEQLRAAGVNTVRYLDIGGGLGVSYDDEETPDLHRFARALVSRVQPTGLTLLMEPGRFVVGNSGMLLTRVLYRKFSGGRHFLVTDAGMTELIRPSHYDAYHRIEPVAAPSGHMTADVVGPVCESGDFLALDRELPEANPGDLLAVHDVGAYGYVMASNYNTRPRGAEVLVDGDRYAVVTARERYEDLVHLELDHPEWRKG